MAAIHQSFLIYLKTQSHTGENEAGLNLVVQESRGLVFKKLFQKKLTASDVGKLNRLVIPKKYAIKYFPPLVGNAVDNVDGRKVDDKELVFYDRSMRSWKFHYCYWSSSQSFIFTRGWNRFLKDKELKEKDIIYFNLCQCRRGMKEDQMFFMIDIYHRQYAEMHVALCLGLGQEDYDKNKDIQEKQQMKVEPTTKTKEYHGFRLFGVQIS